MLKEKIAFITGSTRGIGWAIAETFAREGAKVVLNGRSDEALLRTRAEDLERRFGTEVMTLFGDVAREENNSKFFQAIFARFKRLDILVNNAGILDDRLIGMISEESIATTFQVNTFATIRSLQSAARLMMRNKSGSIINLSSIIGTNGNVGQIVYGGSKAAVIGVTHSAAKELAPHQIRVNAIAPGYIATDMIRQIPPPKHEERVASIKMKRVGTPEDVANVALFLASDLSTYVTGQVIGVDGGMLI